MENIFKFTKIFAVFILSIFTLNANAKITDVIKYDNKFTKNKIIFATPKGTGTKSGKSWKNSKTLNSALENAQKYQTILVAKGSYYADFNRKNTDATFVLKNNIRIYGGFDPSDPKKARDLKASILEGKLNSNLNTKLLVKGENLDNTTVLDGFTIQNSLNSGKDVSGAGMYLQNSNPILKNLTFKNNKLTGKYSKGGGGAIYNKKSSPSISYASFTNNSTEYIGGAIANSDKSNPSISNSIFTNNSAKLFGGAIYNLNSSPNIRNVNFTNNSTKLAGGAIYNKKSIPSIVNAIFTNNSAKSWGGAIVNGNNSNANISNTTFTNNSVKEGGGAITNIESSPNISDVIFTNNSANNGGAIANMVSSPNISYATFTGNSAIGEYSIGGAIFNVESSPSISYTTFTNNFAEAGGAISNEKSNPNISNTVFENNSANLVGGAIMSNEKSNMHISNTIFGNNFAKLGGGAILNIRSNTSISNTNFIGNFFVSNEKEAGGGAIANTESNSSISSSIFWNNKNTKTKNINNIHNHDTKSKMVIKNSIFNTNSITGENVPSTSQLSANKNKTSNPKFKSSTDFTLQAGSPAIDAGNNKLYLEVYNKIHSTSEATIPAGDKDLSSKPRLQGKSIDIGAYEYQ